MRFPKLPCQFAYGAVLCQLVFNMPGTALAQETRQDPTDSLVTAAQQIQQLQHSMANASLIERQIMPLLVRMTHALSELAQVLNACWNSLISLWQKRVAAFLKPTK